MIVQIAMLDSWITLYQTVCSCAYCIVGVLPTAHVEAGPDHRRKKGLPVKAMV